MGWANGRRYQEYTQILVAELLENYRWKTEKDEEGCY
jgi:hypothetical protein